MNEDLKAVLRDPEISDALKVALIPELAGQRPASGLWRALNNGPVIAALASVLTLGISELVKLNLAEQKSEETLQLDTSGKAHEQSLERLKFQFDVIRSALDDSKSAEDRARTLLFFTEIELLDGLNEEKLTVWGNREDLPGIARPAMPPAEEVMTGAEFRANYGDEVYGGDTSQIISTQAELMGALGCPVRTGADGKPYNPALVALTLPAPMPIAWALKRSVSNVQVHEALRDNFDRAFREIHAAGLWDVVKFGGLYNPIRNPEDPRNWNRTAWAVGLNLNPVENNFKDTAQSFTMHPGIVQAFKSAGFAWSGDRNNDASSFIVSTETLATIAASGYQPRIPAADCG